MWQPLGRGEPAEEEGEILLVSLVDAHVVVDGDAGSQPDRH